MSFEYKVGDRAIVTGNGGFDEAADRYQIQHWLLAGTDVEITELPTGGTPNYRVRGLANFADIAGVHVETQWVHPDDLEPFVESYDGVVLPETLDGTWITLGSVDESTTPTRADALRTAIDILGGVSDDIGDLIDIAEWLYSGHAGRVPA